MVQFSLGPTTRQVHAVGFDIDGVWRNTGYPAYLAICAALTELGGIPPASYGEFVRDFPSDYDAYYRARGIKGGEKEFMTAYRRHLPGFDAMQPFDDVFTVLQHTQQLGLPVFVVSGAETERLAAWFDTHGLSPYINHVFGGSRNKSVCIAEACDRLGVMPDVTCFIGDCGLDMRAANDHQAIAIGITRGHNSADALRESGAAYVIEHLSEMVDALS